MWVRRVSKYQCPLCNKIYDTEEEAKQCCKGEYDVDKFLRYVDTEISSIDKFCKRMYGKRTKVNKLKVSYLYAKLQFQKYSNLYEKVFLDSRIFSQDKNEEVKIRMKHIKNESIKYYFKVQKYKKWLVDLAIKDLKSFWGDDSPSLIGKYSSENFKESLFLQNELDKLRGDK